MIRTIHLTLALAILGAGPWSAAAQPPRPATGTVPPSQSVAPSNWLARSTVTQWSVAAELVLGAIEAMPADKFTYRPPGGGRSFVDQVNHTSGVAAVLLAWVAETAQPEGGNDTFMARTTRAQALEALKATIAAVDAALKGMTDERLRQQVDTTFFGRTSKQDVLANLIGHTNRQYGQIVVYLRLNGITPPASRQP